MRFLLTTIQENSTMELEVLLTKEKGRGRKMAGAILVERELYVDVEIKEEQLQEIYLYQVDFLKDRTFRTKEYSFKKEELPEEELQEEMIETEERPAPPEPLELFKEQWELLCTEEIPADVYATNAMDVMTYVFEPLTKKYPDFSIMPEIGFGREYIHDCVSMGRVVSMSVFDEEQHLSAGIRRKLKERYHEYVDEVKAERESHIFIRQMVSKEMPVLLLYITDKNFKVKKQVMLNRGMKEETLAVRLREILALYPEADIIVDAVTPEIYRLFSNINQFMGMESKRILFSMESMFSALGRMPEYEEDDIVKMYLSYIRNQEEMRLGTFVPEHLYSVHMFYLPVQISSEKAWKKQFKKNTMWKSNGRESYRILAEGDLKGKYIIRSGKENYMLKLRSVSVQRYLKKYAVIRLEAENYCYPGEYDQNRINRFASCLFNGEYGVDSLELKLKNGKQAYSLTTIPATGNESQLWLNGLLLLGQGKKKQGKKALTFTAMKEKMYCLKEMELPEEVQITQNAVIRDAVFRKIEDALAKAMKPEKSERPAGRLSKGQKKEIKDLYEMYRYMVVSFGEAYETSQDFDRKLVFEVTEGALETEKVKKRLKEKFDCFF